MAAHSIIKGRKMEDLLQLVLEADDDAGLSAAVEQFYVLGPGLKKEFGAILKAFKVDGLVVSCTDAPKGDKDLIREKIVNMAYFSKKKEGYSHTCSEMDAVAIVAERDGLDPERIGSIDARSCAKLARAIIKKKKEGGKTPVPSKAPKAPTPASEPSSPNFAVDCRGTRPPESARACSECLGRPYCDAWEPIRPSPGRVWIVGRFCP